MPRQSKVHRIFIVKLFTIAAALADTYYEYLLKVYLLEGSQAGLPTPACASTLG